MPDLFRISLRASKRDREEGTYVEIEIETRLRFRESIFIGRISRNYAVCRCQML